MSTLRIDLPLLLPDLPDARDACVSRLQAQLAPRKGIITTHVRTHDSGPEFCLHYDPSLISGEEVRQLAKSAGAEVHGRFGHHIVALRAIAGEDSGRRIEETLSFNGRCARGLRQSAGPTSACRV